jgi:tetraacyldisaccharide 4'-kinase
VLAREPSWWYGTQGLLSAGHLLAPIGQLYGALAARRMAQAAVYRASLPVICVGNFTAGGTGKTPFVKTLLGLLHELGHVPVVLSRGYGGQSAGPLWVDATLHTARDVGDEPLVHAAYVPVVVARDRAAGARLIEAGGALPQRATVIVMDDGLQNPALAKDLRIAIVDAARGLGNGRCIPAGPLRAPLTGQLAATDAIVINQGDSGTVLDAILRTAFEARTTPLLSAHIAPAASLAWLKRQKVVAFAGIGVPERFFATVRGAGATIVDAQSFPDHHTYTDADAARLLARSRADGAILVTTDKDRARLAGAVGPLKQLADFTRVVSIELVLHAASRSRLLELIALHAPLRASSDGMPNG